MSANEPGKSEFGVSGRFEPFELVGDPVTPSDFRIRPDYGVVSDQPIGFEPVDHVGLSWAFEAVDQNSTDQMPSWQSEAGHSNLKDHQRRTRLAQFLEGLEAAGVHGVIIDQNCRVQGGTSKWARRIEASSTLRLKDGILTALTARSMTDLHAGLGVLYQGYPGKHLSIPLRNLDGWVIDMVRLYKCEATLGNLVAVLLPKTAQDEMPNITGLQVFAGLTKSEVNIATLLSQARMVEEIAAIRKTSVATVKSQIKALLAKLGLRRQADLVRLVSTAR